MTIFFVGDPHNRFEEIIQAIDAHRPEAVILLGDMTVDVPLHDALQHVVNITDVWWIHGNHDCDEERWYEHLFESQLADRNLNGRVAEIGGLRIAGLGGVFRGRFWHPNYEMRWHTRDEYLRQAGKGNRWRGGLPLKARCAIWWEDYDRLSRQHADILVTHEAPGCHHHGFGIIDDLARSMEVRTIYHGHHHRDYTAEIEGGITVRGVGLAGITDEHGNIILCGLESEY